MEHDTGSRGRAHGGCRVAVLIPCLDEEASSAQVVRDFKSQIPDAEIYVFDNSSTDRTVEEAKRAGAIVRHEKRQGKGYVIRLHYVGRQLIKA
jgi:glycosyltransferase involved in cell wall biosynthesis